MYVLKILSLLFQIRKWENYREENTWFGKMSNLSGKQSQLPNQSSSLSTDFQWKFWIILFVDEAEALNKDTMDVNNIENTSRTSTDNLQVSE